MRGDLQQFISTKKFLKKINDYNFNEMHLNFIDKDEANN